MGDTIMEMSQILSWIGTATGMLIGIPQLVKTIRTRKTGDLSATTFILILMTCACLLVRAIAIKRSSIYFLLYFSDLNQLTATFPDLEVQGSEHDCVTGGNFHELRQNGRSQSRERVGSVLLAA
jgi:uncharacterized protein with PQ loop repeat